MNTEPKASEGEPLSNPGKVTIAAIAAVLVLADQFTGGVVASRAEEIIVAHEHFLIVAFTAAIAWFTRTLWRATSGLQTLAAVQSQDMRELVRNATISADASIVSAMPILSPYVTDAHRLYPHHPTFDPATKVTTVYSKVFFTFENFGKTPGIIREVRADLFVIDRDEVPAIDYDVLPSFDYEVIIPGDARENSGATSVIDHQRDFTMTLAAFELLQAKATDEFKRMVLVGRVIYDDFFELRHTRLFCVKMRLMWNKDGELSVFKAIHGGASHNRITRKSIPKDAPQ